MRRISKRGLIGGALAAGMVAAVTTVASPMTQATAASPPNSPQAVQQLAANAAASTVAARPAYLHASADDAFVRHAVISGAGAQYVPYDRTYRGLPVIGGDFVIVTDNHGHVIDHSVAQTQAINLPSTTPSVTAAQSLATARHQIDTVKSATKPSLAVYAKGSPRLVWNDEVTGTKANKPSILSVYVDALTGKVLGTREHVAFGDGDAVYNGPEPVHIDTSQVGGQYEMVDPNITNLECDDLSTDQPLTKSTDSWGDGNETDIETGCVDALYTAQTENKMLHQWLGRNAMDGNGGAWPIRVGLDDENAFYDGTQVEVGHNTAGDWIGALDVVGHEMGHGIDDHTPGSMSGNGTQEFVADTFGAATEWYANEPAPYETPNFTVGEMVNLEGTGPIRYMYDPSKVNQPDCYDSSVPGMEVHAASGPGDHWFYLMAEGTNPTNGQPTSPTCNNSTVTGIGIENAIKVMYNAMLMKTSASSYLTYRTWTLEAAKQVFPNDCTEFNTVKAAWDAVSVPAQPDDPTCSSSPGGVTAANPGSQSGTVGTAASLQLSASGGTSPYTWSAAGLPAGLSISGAGLISGTPTTAGTYTVTATVKDSTGATGSTSFTWTIAPQGGGTCNGVAAWSSSKSYAPNDVVSYNGHKWTSQWYSTNVEPGSPEAWDIWKDDGTC